jgi:hypothetical protein
VVLVLLVTVLMVAGLLLLLLLLLVKGVHEELELEKVWITRSWTKRRCFKPSFSWCRCLCGLAFNPGLKP